METLHTFLLGIVKYCWRIVHTSWGAKDGRIDIFIARLASLPNDGIGKVTWSAKSVVLHSCMLESTYTYYLQRYIHTYRNVLNGKHFRILSQLLPFAVHGLVSQEIFELVKAMGNLGAHLWFTQISNIDQYTVRV